MLDTPAPSAEFTEKSEPGLVWDAPGNTRTSTWSTASKTASPTTHPTSTHPCCLITPVPGEGSVKNESFWLQTSPQAKQVQLSCGEEPTEGPCATKVADFVEGLDTSRQ